MRSLLTLILFVCGAAACAQEAVRIDQAVLLERMERQDASMIILDVRTPEEFAAGHVPGAINIPHTELPARAAEIAAARDDKDVVLYCRSGARAQRAAEELRRQGFKRLLHLDGDMLKWQENERPIEK